MVKLKLEDNMLKTEGDYEFHLSNLHYNPDTNKSVMLITFYHSPEKPETAHNDQCIEVLAEKLKQDFIAFSKNKYQENHTK